MIKKTSDEVGFLKDLKALLRKYTQAMSLPVEKQDNTLYARSNVNERFAVNDRDNTSDLPTATVSIMTLLTRLIDLEERVRVAEKRGEVLPIAELGQVIRDARKRQELTVEDLADLAGVGSGTITKVEKGSFQVQVPKLVQITEALGLELLVSSR